MKRISADDAYIDGVLADGADRARVIADETLRQVCDIVGFVRGVKSGTKPAKLARR
jgi:tryptophanyl-tRNA synthetase